MYYKILKNNTVIDVLDNLIYLKWDPRHNIMVLSDENEAQAILSSDKDHAWHERSLYKIPVDGYETVDIEEIGRFEFEQLKMLQGKTPDEIVDAVILSLINDGVI